MTPRAQRAVEKAARALMKLRLPYIKNIEDLPIPPQATEEARAALIAALIELATQEDGRHIWAYLDNLLSDLKGA
jgi:hypothetical protein